MSPRSPRVRPLLRLCRSAPLGLVALCAAHAQPPRRSAAPSGAQPPPLAFGPTTLVAQNGARVDVDTATLRVPENRRTASGRTVTVPVLRFRSTAAHPGAPIVYLSGGSGSGIAAARGARLDFFLALREAGDVVTLDLRGAGRSRPRIDCPAGELLPVATPMGYDALTARLAHDARRCAASLRAAGIDPAGYNVREIVEDVDALRRALGAPRVRLWGTSTGSQLGLEYLRRHGAHVERAALFGVQAPDQNLHLPAAQERVVRALAAQFQGPNEAGAAPAQTDLVAVLRTVFDTLARRPQRVIVPAPDRRAERNAADSVAVTLGTFDAQLLVAATLGERRAMALLPPVFGAAATGNYTPLASFKLEAARGGIQSPFEALGDCQTGAPPARRRQAAREARTALLGRATLDFPGSCTGWGVPELAASYRAPVRSPVPVLLVSGTLDGRTPVANAEAALRGLPNGSHVIIEGASHGDDLFLAAPEVAPLTRRFFRGEALGRRTVRLQAQ